MACIEMDQSVMKSAGTTRGAFVEVLIGILPALLKLPCFDKPPPTPAPADPRPEPTATQASAWEQAHKVKSNATEAWQGDKYALGVISKGAAKIRKAKRADGEQVKRREAVLLAVAALDHARESDTLELAEELEEIS